MMNLERLGEIKIFIEQYDSIKSGKGNISKIKKFN